MLFPKRVVLQFLTKLRLQVFPAYIWRVANYDVVLFRGGNREKTFKLYEIKVSVKVFVYFVGREIRKTVGEETI